MGGHGIPRAAMADEVLWQGVSRTLIPPASGDRWPRGITYSLFSTLLLYCVGGGFTLLPSLLPQAQLGALNPRRPVWGRVSDCLK